MPSIARAAIAKALVAHTPIQALRLRAVRRRRTPTTNKAMDTPIPICAESPRKPSSSERISAFRAAMPTIARSAPW